MPGHYLPELLLSSSSIQVLLWPSLNVITRTEPFLKITSGSHAPETRTRHVVYQAKEMFASLMASAITLKQVTFIAAPAQIERGMIRRVTPTFVLMVRAHHSKPPLLFLHHVLRSLFSRLRKYLGMGGSMPNW